MAENESLDLSAPGGQRWLQVFDAIAKGKPAEEVAWITGQKLSKALTKAFKQLIESDVSFPKLLKNRHDPEALERLVREAKGHAYAHLFAETARAEAAGDDRQLVTCYLNSIFERVTDQIVQAAVGTDGLPNFYEAGKFFEDVRRLMDPEIDRIATKLAMNPAWLPRTRRKSGSSDLSPTHGLLGMSLLVRVKR